MGKGSEKVNDFPVPPSSTGEKTVTVQPGKVSSSWITFESDTSLSVTVPSWWMNTGTPQVLRPELTLEGEIRVLSGTHGRARNRRCRDGEGQRESEHHSQSETRTHRPPPSPEADRSQSRESAGTPRSTGRYSFNCFLPGQGQRRSTVVLIEG